MARWTTVAETATIVETLADNPMFEAAGEVLDGAAVGLQALSDAIGVFEAFTTPDPLSAIAGTALAEFQEFVVEVLGADVYAFPLLPKTWSDLLRPYAIDDALNDLAASVGDTRDPDRPVFPEGLFASLTVAVGANNWMDFTRLITIFGELFDGTEFNRWSRLFDVRANYDAHIPLPRRDRNSQGVPWDWERTNWMELVPPVADAIEKAFEAAETIVGVGKGLTSAVQQLVDALTARATYVRGIVDELNRVVNLVRRWKDLFPSMRVLYATGSGGTSGFVTAVTDAGDRPEYKLMGGLVFVAFGPDAQAHLDAVSRLIGLTVAEARR